MGSAILAAVKDRKFLITGVILFISALGIQATAKYLQLHFRKQYLPLRKPLQDFDARKLYPPYKDLTKGRMGEDVEEALGTKEYVQILFENTEITKEEDFGKTFNFFVTYYSGDPDQVPHVPDVCYLGGGYDPAGATNTTVTVPGLGLQNDQLPVRVLFFKNSRDFVSRYQTVVYFFSVNGKFVEDRTSVRWYLGDIRYKYAYFSKVELNYLTREVAPNLDEVLNYSTKFLEKALPILVREHWADWKEVIKK